MREKTITKTTTENVSQKSPQGINETATQISSTVIIQNNPKHPLQNTTIKNDPEKRTILIFDRLVVRDHYSFLKNDL